MKDIAISRRYAKALMLIGKEDDNADQYRDELGGMAALIENEATLRQAISNPVYDHADRRKVLLAVVEKLDLSRVMSSFVVLLFDKGRFGFLGSINDFYQNLADELKGIVHASVTSAVALSKDAVEKMQAALSGLTGKDVVLDIEQDSELIGGIVARIGDLVLDGSIKTQLLNMKESFKRGESV